MQIQEVPAMVTQTLAPCLLSLLHHPCLHHLQDLQRTHHPHHLQLLTVPLPVQMLLLEALVRIPVLEISLRLHLLLHLRPQLMARLLLVITVHIAQTCHQIIHVTVKALVAMVQGLLEVLLELILDLTVVPRGSSPPRHCGLPQPSTTHIRADPPANVASAPTSNVARPTPAPAGTGPREGGGRAVVVTIIAPASELGSETTMIGGPGSYNAVKARQDVPDEGVSTNGSGETEGSGSNGLANPGQMDWDGTSGSGSPQDISSFVRADITASGAPVTKPSVVTGGSTRRTTPSFLNYGLFLMVVGLFLGCLCN
ncbi:hypothetical protein G7046_g10170 [Stylonectria norvegica]|nr:hypothetical protein G7046_g10170 [Stylonectria norvegica]